MKNFLWSAICFFIDHRYCAADPRNIHPYMGTCSRCGDQKTFIHDGCF